LDTKNSATHKQQSLSRVCEFQTARKTTNGRKAATAAMNNVATDLPVDHENEGQVNHIVGECMMERRGLFLVGYSKKQIASSGKETNKRRFRAHFGASAVVCCQIYEDMQCTDIEQARIAGGEIDLKWFLMAMHYLRKYPKEDEWESTFDVGIRWTRDRIWDRIRKLAAMKAKKIVWPDSLNGDNMLGLTVDGVHSAAEEPKHPVFSQDKAFFSHKHGRAGYCFELGISLSESQLVWMNGPYPAGMSDAQIFVNKGLKSKLKTVKAKAIGDGGYFGHPKWIITPNAHDSRAVRKFKGRALKRHEKFNGHIKTFECTSSRFRHGQDKFKDCFEAVCVVCQYVIEIDIPLYDILIEDVFRDEIADWTYRDGFMVPRFVTE
jgi:DDE superfamily endonuclease